MNQRILVVEDECLIAEDIKNTLIQSGYQVIGISTSGKDAIERTLAERPALISMDIKIKGEIDGIETARRIKSEFDIPIIFMSSTFDPETLRRAQRVSSWFIQKPFHPNEFLKTTALALTPPWAALL